MIYDDVSGKPPAGTRQTSISLERYRRFVGNNPDKATYFQPVLDRLQVVPSRLDALVPSVLVEGKGDYLIITSGLTAIGRSGSYAVIPTRGADHFDELVGIMLGWGIDFALCCDDDPPGRRAVAEFTKDWGLSATKVFTLKEVDDSLTGKGIEGFLEKDDLNRIKSHFGLSQPPTKSQIQLFFSEMLASGTKLDFSRPFLDRLRAFDEKVRIALSIKNDAN